MTDLLPCPFCGIDKPTMKEFGGGIYIECRDCPAVIEENTEVLAASAWNTRTPPMPIQTKPILSPQ